MLKRLVRVVVMVLVVPLLAASTCGGDEPTPDAAVPYVSQRCMDNPNPCAADVDCSDGLVCNGMERCHLRPFPAGADSCGCKASEPLICAPGASCNEELNRCESCRTDNDGDGHRSLDCMGDDCDDNDPNRFPGRQEVCDVADHDEDCDPTTYGQRDADGDQFFDAQCCNVNGAGVRSCGPDCQDSNAAIVPGAQICNKSDSSNVYICQISGAFGTAIPCGLNQTCTEQPNGLGICN